MIDLNDGGELQVDWPWHLLGEKPPGWDTRLGRKPVAPDLETITKCLRITAFQAPVKERVECSYSSCPDFGSLPYPTPKEALEPDY